MSAIDPQSLLTFDDFRKQFIEELRRHKPDYEVTQDDHNIVMVAPNGEAGVVSVDILYRFFVDAAIKRPEATREELFIGCHILIDTWRRNTDRPPILEPSERPASLENLQMMQKCVGAA